MHKEIRKQQILKRRNFLPSLVFTFILLISLICIIYFTDPKFSLFIILFFLNLFIFLFFLFSLIFANSREGFLISICLVIFALFSFFGVGNILNALLLAGLGIIALLYERFTKRNN